MITWAGRLIALYGAAHTLGALTVEGAARHVDVWFSRELWSESFSDMSPAMSAYWFSVNSFGPPLILLGLTVLWLNRRAIMPPSFIAWSLGAWLAIDLILSGPGVGQGLIIATAVILLLVAARRAKPAGPAVSPTLVEP